MIRRCRRVVSTSFLVVSVVVSQSLSIGGAEPMCPELISTWINGESTEIAMSATRVVYNRRPVVGRSIRTASSSGFRRVRSDAPEARWLCTVNGQCHQDRRRRGGGCGLRPCRFQALLVGTMRRGASSAGWPGRVVAGNSSRDGRTCAAPRSLDLRKPRSGSLPSTRHASEDDRSRLWAGRWGWQQPRHAQRTRPQVPSDLRAQRLSVDSKQPCRLRLVAADAVEHGANVGLFHRSQSENGFVRVFGDCLETQSGRQIR